MTDRHPRTVHGLYAQFSVRLNHFDTVRVDASGGFYRCATVGQYLAEYPIPGPNGGISVEEAYRLLYELLEVLTSLDPRSADARVLRARLKRARKRARIAKK